MPTESHKDDLFGAMLVIVLLIGTATDNALVLLGMSVAALILLVVFGDCVTPRHPRWPKQSKANER
jgi:hypothetical protein